MNAQERKKKPKAPSMPLSEAIDKATLIYDRERRVVVSSEVVADALGYKNARSGSAITSIASIKMFGLLDSPKAGHLVVDETFEEYKYSPDERVKNQMLIKWLKTPKIFNDLLLRFESHPPSEAALKYELIKMGFSGKGLTKFIDSFKQSYEFAGYYTTREEIGGEGNDENITKNLGKTPYTTQGGQVHQHSHSNVESDRIPIRLTGGRRAWLELPVPFYEADKEVIKNQINLIVVDEEDKNDEV